MTHDNIFMQGAYHGVPLVGMPLFAEQPDNIARAIDRGFALSVSVKKLDTLAKDLEQAIRRILKEPSFAVNAARVSHLMKAHRGCPAEIAASEHSPLHILLFWLFKQHPTVMSQRALCDTCLYMRFCHGAQLILDFSCAS